MATTDENTAINQEKIESFDDEFKSIEHKDRLNFMRKVFGILSVQLILTASMVGVVKNNPEWNERINWNGYGWFTFCSIVVFVT